MEPDKVASIQMIMSKNGQEEDTIQVENSVSSKDDVESLQKDEDGKNKSQQDHVGLLTGTPNSENIEQFISIESKSLIKVVYRIQQWSWVVYVLSCLLISIFIGYEVINAKFPIVSIVEFAPNDPEVARREIDRKGTVEAQSQWEEIERHGTFEIQYLFLATFTVGAFWYLMSWTIFWKIYRNNILGRKNPFRWIRFGLNVTLIFFIQNAFISPTEPKDFITIPLMIGWVVSRGYMIEDQWEILSLSNTPSRSKTRHSSESRLNKIDVCFSLLTIIGLIIMNLWSFLINLTYLTPRWFTTQEVVISLMVLIYSAILVHQYHFATVETYLKGEIFYLLSSLCFEMVIIWSYVYDLYRWQK